DEAFELFDTAREATDDVRAWLGLADTLRNQGAHDDALRVLDDAFAAVDWSDDERARLWLERSWILAVAGRHAETIESALAGLQALHSHTGPIAGQLLLPLSRAEQMEGKLDDALAHGLEARGIFEAEGDLANLARAFGIGPLVAHITDSLAVIALGEGDPAEAADRYEEAAELWIGMDATTWAERCLTRAAEAAERAGDAQRARGLGSRARSLSAQ